ncbi:MAG TPA: hypothetical protein VK034_07455 [Enhygromyxa sp.]|nr:hypothetical protein [Enhygromyxa sp.]
MKTSTHTLCLLIGFAVALLGSASARGAAGGGYCPGEVLGLVEPTIAVVDGPGDVATQQELWSGSIYFEGPLDLWYDDHFLNLEEIP